MDHVAAAALPLGALTAWQALHEHARLKPGQHVLVHGGAGGVGAYRFSSRRRRCRLTATASARDRGFVAGLGAGQVIDYSGRFEDQVGDVDVVVDPVGGQTMVRSWPVLRAGGILVAIAEEPGAVDGGRSDVRGVFFIVRPDGSQLRELATLIDQQQLRPAVSVTFELSDLAAAFRASTALGLQARWLSASTIRHAPASRPGRRVRSQAATFSAAGTVSGSQHRRQATPCRGCTFG